MPHPEDLLSTRSIISAGKFALLSPEGLVNNVIPGFHGARISIVASPKYGASFVEYLLELQPGGGNAAGFGGEGIECFVYLLSGRLTVGVANESYQLFPGGYVYVPAGQAMTFANTCQENARLLLYKQRYQPLPGREPWVVVGNSNTLAHPIYDRMESVTVCDLLPTDLAFDMNFHILTFQPGSSHPFVETHVQEHGAYLVQGEGIYFLDNRWIPVKKGDFIWFGPYVPQACYGVGREALSYIYSKDCNRDVII